MFVFVLYQNRCYVVSLSGLNFSYSIYYLHTVPSVQSNNPTRSGAGEQSKQGSEQGGENFITFVKKKISLWMGVNSKMSVCLSVCLLSVVCGEFVPNYLLNRWSDWDTIVFTTIR
jgi:hypothetical protein